MHVLLFAIALGVCGLVGEALLGNRVCCSAYMYHVTGFMDFNLSTFSATCATTELGTSDLRSRIVRSKSAIAVSMSSALISLSLNVSVISTRRLVTAEPGVGMGGAVGCTPDVSCSRAAARSVARRVHRCSVHDSSPPPLALLLPDEGRRVTPRLCFFEAFFVQVSL